MREEAVGITVVVVGVILLALLITSCVRDYRSSTPIVTWATFTDKEYRPGHYETVCSPTTDMEGKITGVSCSEDWIPDDWRVTYVEAEDGSQHETSVSSSTYYSLKIGDRKVLKYFKGGGFWGARYQVQFLLGPVQGEGGMPVR